MTPARPMIGLLCQLTPEQRARALAYEGDDTMGDPAFAIEPAPGGSPAETE